MTVSVLLPALNEATNLTEVVPELMSVMNAAGFDYEVVIVDDGSTDDTPSVTERLALDQRVRGIRMRRNFGKSAALQAGFAATTADIIVLMDADGQDDPREIPRLIATLESGFDLVTGSRTTRRDRFLKRTTSRLFNRVTTAVTGVSGTDFNSGLKVMRRVLTDQLNLYGELHRYIPVLAHWLGFRVTECPVNHRPRRYGETKFGAARFWRGFLDLVTVQFLTRFTARPLHLFGGIGLLFGLAGGGLLAWMLVLRILGQGIGQRPALLTGVLLSVLAVQFISIGLVGELIVHWRGRVDGGWMLEAPSRRWHEADGPTDQPELVPGSPDTDR
jgi:glycosyltransferase involved in cell wall biosynthesis